MSYFVFVFRNHNAKIIHAPSPMSRYVRQCPAMSRYILIKVKKNGKYLLEW